MKKLRVAIIGQGRSGRDIHWAHLRQLTEMFEVVAAVDPLEVRRVRAAEEIKCDVYADYKPLLKRRDLDLVVNASPSHLHVPITLALFKAGHNVLTEKPLARTVKEVDRLAAAAKKAGKLFAIFQQSRFAPYFEQVQKVIDSGALGRIVQISIAFNGFARRWDWQTLTEWNGGNLMNTGPHPLDQALRLMDVPLDRAPQVFCYMDRAHFAGDAEGHVKLILRAEERPLVDLEISSCCAYPLFTYHVYGTQGGLKGNTAEMEWRYFDPSKAPKLTATTVPIHNADWTPAYCRESLTWQSDSWKAPHEEKDFFQTLGFAFYKMLHAHMTQGGPLLVTPEQVRQQIAVIEEAQRQNPQIWRKKAGKRRQE